MRLKKLNDVSLRKAIVILVILLLAGSFQALFSQENELQKIDRWLALGPAKIPAAEKILLKDDTALLNFSHISITGLSPVAGKAVAWGKDETLTWRVLSDCRFPAADTTVLYLAAFIGSERWLKAKLSIAGGKSEPSVLVFLDGQRLETAKVEGKISADLELLNQEHLLVLKILLPAGQELNLETFLKKEEPFQEETLHVSLSPVRRVQEADILNAVYVQGTAVSPDGKLAAVFLTQTAPGSGEQRDWLEILDIASGEIVFTTANYGKMADFAWLKDSFSFTYTRTEEDKTALFKYDLNRRSAACILEKIADFSSYWWSNDNSFLIYSQRHQEKREGGYKYIKDISDRSKYSGTRYSLNIYFPSGGITHKITEKEQDFSDALISPDGKKALLLKNEPDNRNRPYIKYITYLLDVGTLQTKPLTESNWAYPSAWSPDSKKILFLGGPSSFNGIGKNLKVAGISNDYDVQAFICDIQQVENAQPISKHFDPSIDAAFWTASSNRIYFTATDRSDVAIYRYSPAQQSYKKFVSLVGAVSNIGFARQRDIAVYWGSSAGIPHKLYKLNLASGKAELLKDYNKETFKNVRIGKVVPWDFKSKEGKTITGRLHYPVDFDRDKKYPCIVYYYGGTSPVENNFGGRYPFDWYTAKGYIVYVLQPSGTVGFGQDFSAVHVNDWGKTTSEEILTGVGELLKAHPYIDAAALGAMGASYGGFMTQYLATCTDRFAAFISHAGISSLASYWGIGDWGYTYSGIATADSFPWNRKDIYVGHSPLFMADRITKPILLLHGDADNNVPPGESYQMFAALKLLNKEVALVTFDNLAHLILEYKKRLHWMHTIIAWFDKYLKNQPQYWDKLYPQKK